ncbi:unnamed protein product [Cylicostephanus goldi]|uniref:Secreted protein n=1 Tax=Cylicostephanus goldi TaxID=71465 RepID=A0A3P7MWM5_CYLGO|nr:unnamed protein product [Cylicostephanus goldi]
MQWCALVLLLVLRQHICGAGEIAEWVRWGAYGWSGLMLTLVLQQHCSHGVKYCNCAAVVALRWGWDKIEWFGVDSVVAHCDCGWGWCGMEWFGVDLLKPHCICSAGEIVCWGRMEWFGVDVSVATALCGAGEVAEWCGLVRMVVLQQHCGCAVVELEWNGEKWKARLVLELEVERCGLT